MHDGQAALDLLTSQLDTHQAQVQGTFCADEVFCGRDPERGTETCTVVEHMASFEQAFATLGRLELMDRVERLAFNALPAALTADMWTHVYVQQANSVFAGVTHPKATSHHGKEHGGEHHRPGCPHAACGTADPNQGRDHGPGAGAAPGVTGDGPSAFEEIQDVQYLGTSHFPCCITNFPQGWPKFAQSVVLSERAAGGGLTTSAEAAVIVASLVPFKANVAAARASVAVDSAYPFGDQATITVTADAAAGVVVKVRIPRWATKATVDGKPAANGTLVAVRCAQGKTTIAVDLKPEVVVEEGWGSLDGAGVGGVAVTRGPLVFALHPRENRTVKRYYNTTPAWIGQRAPDYIINTTDRWNYAIDVGEKATFDAKQGGNWSIGFPFDDANGNFPFSVHVTGRRAQAWGYWRGSLITAPPPASPLPCNATSCGPPTPLRLVPFGSTNLRIAVFPFVGSKPATPAQAPN